MSKAVLREKLGCGQAGFGESGIYFVLIDAGWAHLEGDQVPIGWRCSAGISAAKSCP